MVEKQEKTVGFTFQARKIQIKNRIRDDSIQSEKGSTDHGILRDLSLCGRLAIKKVNRNWLEATTPPTKGKQQACF